jgi:hypothetical protein
LQVNIVTRQNMAEYSTLAGTSGYRTLATAPANSPSAKLCFACHPLP